MDTEAIKAELLKLTEGMLYISESDYEIDVQEYGVLDKTGLLQKISAASGTAVADIAEQEADTFFNKTIKALDPTDDYAAELAQQYKALYAYLRASFKEISVLRAGEIQVHIYIACFTVEGNCFTLHTTSVET